MGIWNANSDRDWYEECGHYSRPPKCANPGCEERITFPADAFCSRCQVEQREAAIRMRQQFERKPS